MSVEIANVIEAMFAFRADGTDPPQLIAGAGVRAATLTRDGVGLYRIDLEQPLTRDVTAIPAQGRVDYLLSPNIESVSDATVQAQLGAGAVAGVFDRISIQTRLAGALADFTETAPISCIVFRFPSIG